VLNDAAAVYKKVDTNAIVVKVKQEFTAKDKAKTAKKAAPSRQPSNRQKQRSSPQPPNLQSNRNTCAESAATGSAFFAPLPSASLVRDSCHPAGAPTRRATRPSGGSESFGLEGKVDRILAPFIPVGNRCATNLALQSRCRYQ